MCKLADIPQISDHKTIWKLSDKLWNLALWSSQYPPQHFLLTLIRAAITVSKNPRTGFAHEGSDCPAHQ